jgi:hypothetical protein
VVDLGAELANFERQTLRTVTADQKQQILELPATTPTVQLGESR